MATATVEWIVPVTREDGRALAIDEIQHVEISMSADGGANFSPPQQIPPTAAQEMVVENLVPGDYVFRAVVVDTDGRRSAAEEVVASVLANPSPVQGMTVTIT